MGEYLGAYTKATQSWGQCYFVDLFAGCGECFCVQGKHIVDGSALRAVKKEEPAFTRSFLIEKDEENAQHLREVSAKYGERVKVIHGDCNEVIDDVLSGFSHEAPSFAFLDPEGYSMLHWCTVEKLAAHRHDRRGQKMEMLILFPLEMALLRNLTRICCEPSITRFYGNTRWLKVRDAVANERLMSDEVRSALVELYKDGLRRLDYKHVEDFQPERERPLYRLIFAGDNAVGVRIMTDVWARRRFLPCELSYGIKQPRRRTLRDVERQ